MPISSVWNLLEQPCQDSCAFSLMAGRGTTDLYIIQGIQRELCKYILIDEFVFCFQC